jgi:hypothetical protein
LRHLNNKLVASPLPPWLAVPLISRFGLASITNDLRTPRKRLPPYDFSVDNLWIMVSFSGGGGGGAALGSPAGILVLLVVIALIAGVYWLFNR